jgi:hypothetical protein
MISIADYVGNSAASKVLYEGNSNPENNSLRNLSMGVYINQGPGCDSTASNYKYYSWPAEAGLTAICTHKPDYSSNESTVDKCSPLASKTACDAA